MKTILTSLLFSFIFLGASAQKQVKPVKQVVITKQIVDVACGECQFKMKGKDCELAVKINGANYFVDGFGIDDFGDAHGEHGFCNAVSKAEVSGTIVNGRFKATAFKLVEPKKA